MTYEEQLLDQRWLQKRREILLRDNYSCQECYNESYRREFKTGLIVSKYIDFFRKSHYSRSKWRFLVWDFSQNFIFSGGINNPKYSPDKSYICYYRNECLEGLSKNLIWGLKEIPDSNIKFKDVRFFSMMVENNFREMVEEQTFNLVHSTAIDPGTWSVTCGLHVHHKYYQESHFAWEYSNEALVTLCPDCHQNVHQTSEIPVIDESGRELKRISSTDVLPGRIRTKRRRRNK